MTGSPLLTAATPADWRARHGRAGSVDPVRSDAEPPPPRWIGAPELLDGRAGELRATHERLCRDATPPVPAAKWVVSWFAGGLADAVGLMLAMAAAAPVVELATARWRMDPGGWPECADPGPVPVVVATGHAWAGLPGTVCVADERAVAARAVTALVAAVSPIVEAGRGLARVGRTALWAEVADGVGLPLLHEVDLPVDAAAVHRLRLALDVPAAPWRKRPDLRVDATDGAAYLGRKGGCCLNYRCPPDPEPDPGALDGRERAYRERFPTRPDQPRYCSTCSLRDLADCEDRQRFWLRQERAARQPQLTISDQSGVT